MTTIKINDLKEAAVVGNQEAADVKGGPMYIKYEGVDGESRNTRPTDSFSLNYTKIEF